MMVGLHSNLRGACQDTSVTSATFFAGLRWVLSLATDRWGNLAGATLILVSVSGNQTWLWGKFMKFPMLRLVFPIKTTTFPLNFWVGNPYFSPHFIIKGGSF